MVAQNRYHSNLDQPGLLNENIDTLATNNILNRVRDLNVFIPNELKQRLEGVITTATRNLHTQLHSSVSQEMSSNRARMVTDETYTLDDYNNDIALRLQEEIGRYEESIARVIMNIAKRTTPILDRSGQQRFTLTERSMVNVQTAVLGLTYAFAHQGYEPFLTDVLYSAEGQETLAPDSVQRIYNLLSQNPDSIIHSINFINQNTLNQTYNQLPDSLRGSVQLLTVLQVLSQEQQSALVRFVINRHIAQDSNATNVLRSLVNNNFVSGVLISREIQNMMQGQDVTRIASLQSLQQQVSVVDTAYQQRLESSFNDSIVAMGIAQHDAGNPALSGKSWLNFIGFYASTVSAVLGGAVCIGSGAGTQALLQYLPNAIVAKSAYESMAGNGYFDWITNLGQGFSLDRENREARDIAEWRDIAVRETLTGNMEQTKFFASDTVINLLLQSIDRNQDNPNFSMSNFEDRLKQNPELHNHYNQYVKSQYQGNLDTLVSKLTLVAYTYSYLQVNNYSGYIQKIAQFQSFTQDNIPNLG